MYLKTVGRCLSLSHILKNPRLLHHQYKINDLSVVFTRLLLLLSLSFLQILTLKETLCRFRIRSVKLVELWGTKDSDGGGDLVTAFYTAVVLQSRENIVNNGSKVKTMRKTMTENPSHRLLRWRLGSGEDSDEASASCSLYLKPKVGCLFCLQQEQDTMNNTSRVVQV
ncbi:uncharacterized protein LOC110925942 isoform X2 [Helianthus annuus]|uniref:uncharacterized protein LOC110925942 isoform X2 n=1 Tax=Helianthus annuus TaxID=4232 RepID=UPI000B8F5BB0|nr:uncharacterized protein LOC110925942 isoform X2 [Helianthus annuus]